MHQKCLYVIYNKNTFESFEAKKYSLYVCAWAEVPSGERERMGRVELMGKITSEQRHLHSGYVDWYFFLPTDSTLHTHTPPRVFNFACVCVQDRAWPQSKRRQERLCASTGPQWEKRHGRRMRELSRGEREEVKMETKTSPALGSPLGVLPLLAKVSSPRSRTLCRTQWVSTNTLHEATKSVKVNSLKSKQNCLVWDICTFILSSLDPDVLSVLRYEQLFKPTSFLFSVHTL